MEFSPRQNLTLRIFTIFGFTFAVLWGAATGLALAGTANTKYSESTEKIQEAIGTKVLDTKQQLITEFYSDEKRDLIPLAEMPKHVADALVVREDQEFWYHPGFSARGFFRALWGIVTDTLVSGGSTLTQQLAKQLYLNPRDKTLTRKIVELWHAFQLERRFSKQEIMQLYLNKMPYGHGAYGVEAASQFFFRKSVREITPAESAILAIQLVLPGKYSPIRYPEDAKVRSKLVLDLLVEEKLLSTEDAEASFKNYWSNYDYNRSSSETLFTTRDDQAPYFSEYIRGQLEDLLPGGADIYKEGYTVYTTLNLDYQKVAEKEFLVGLEAANQIYRESSSVDSSQSALDLIPQLELLALATGIPDIRFVGKQRAFEAREFVKNKMGPILDLTTSLFGLEPMRDVTGKILEGQRAAVKRTVIEGAMVALENKTGHILVMLGGSKFDRTNQFNRAVLAKVQPGSAYKPLYYAVAVDEKKLTAATRLFDGPRTFPSPDGSTYAPFNYGGRWYGNILARRALALSLNIPSLMVLESVGFDPVIDKTSRMLGMTSQREIDTIPRNYPLGLGTLAVSPMQMAQAYSMFPSGGKQVQPISIRYITDRNGNVVANPEADLINQQAAMGDSLQIISPQAAYVMSSMLRSAVTEGTLYSSATAVGKFGNMDMAGKTGTTQNWSDSWAMGFSPYITSVVWYGFDTPGNSMGINNHGGRTSGPVWARFMKNVHSSLPVRKFDRPTTGLVDVQVSYETGLLPAGYAGERTYVETFISGTAPSQTSSEELERKSLATDEALNKLQSVYALDAPTGDRTQESLGDDLNLDDLLFKPEEPPKEPELDFGDLFTSPTE